MPGDVFLHRKKVNAPTDSILSLPKQNSCTHLNIKTAETNSERPNLTTLPAHKQSLLEKCKMWVLLPLSSSNWEALCVGKGLLDGWPSNMPRRVFDNSHGLWWFFQPDVPRRTIPARSEKL